jgi:hypothetical protein
LLKSFDRNLSGLKTKLLHSNTSCDFLNKRNRQKKSTGFFGQSEKTIPFLLQKPKQPDFRLTVLEKQRVFTNLDHTVFLCSGIT